MNRGLARRTIFECSADHRQFLALLAREVRAGRIEVHAFCLLSTHYHLLIRSPEGQLSLALQRLQYLYVRWFNRTRGRDGPLFRGRFCSKPMQTEEQWFAAVRYIDNNPVEAKLADLPQDYELGSARAYSGKARHPWLNRMEIHAAIRDAAGVEEFRFEDYMNVFHRCEFDSGARVVGPREISMRTAANEERAAQPRWMHERARLADGTRAGWTVSDPIRLLAILDEVEIVEPEERVPARRKQVGHKAMVRAAFLREYCGLRLADVALHCGTSPKSVSRWLQRHAALQRTDSSYASQMQSLARTCRQLLGKR